MDSSPASSQIERNVFAAWYNIVQEWRNVNQKYPEIRSDRKKERKKGVRETAEGARNTNQHPIALWPTSPTLSTLVRPCPPLAVSSWIMLTLTPRREHYEGVGPALVSAAYTPDTDTDTDTRLSALPSRMFSCGVELVASPRREPTPRAMRVTRG